VGLQVCESSLGSRLSGDASKGAFTPTDGRLVVQMKSVVLCRTLRRIPVGSTVLSMSGVK
jgi:hypothetical protein